MAIETFKRYEKKYLLSASVMPSFLASISKYMDPDPYCKNGDKYKIHNIYYDTKQFDVIRASNMKPYYKEKLRLRSYYDNLQPDDTVFLELKKKIGGIVNKRRVIIPFSDAEKIINDRTALSKLIASSSDNYLRSQILAEIGVFLERYEVCPAVYLSYSRMAFFCRDNKEFRLTLDTDIKYNFNFPSLAHVQSCHPLIDDETVLMEIKIIGTFPMWLARLLAETDVRKLSMSKYGTAYTMHKFNNDIIYKKFSMSQCPEQCIVTV